MILKKFEKLNLVPRLWCCCGWVCPWWCSNYLSPLIWFEIFILSVLLNLSLKNSDSWFIVLSFFLLMLIYLYKSNIPHYMECCCYIWFGVPNCYLDMLNKSWKWVIRVAGPTLAACLNLLAHRQRWSVWVCIIDNY